MKRAIVDYVLLDTEERRRVNIRNVPQHSYTPSIIRYIRQIINKNIRIYYVLVDGYIICYFIFALVTELQFHGALVFSYQNSFVATTSSLQILFFLSKFYFLEI